MECSKTPQMDKLGRPYGSENPTSSWVLGAIKRRNDDIMYSYNASSCTLIYDKGAKVEDGLLIF